MEPSSLEEEKVVMLVKCPRSLPALPFAQGASLSCRGCWVEPHTILILFAALPLSRTGTHFSCPSLPVWSL